MEDDPNEAFGSRCFTLTLSERAVRELMSGSSLGLSERRCSALRVEEEREAARQGFINNLSTDAGIPR
jgi:hypothetical protein